MSFDNPAPPSSGGIPFGEHLGALLLIDVKGYETGVETVHGVSDAVRADVQVIDGPGAPESYTDALIFPKVLRSQLKNSLGKQVLGRLSQAPAKAGKNPAWLLDAASAQEVAAAEAWVRNQAPAFTPPAAASATDRVAAGAPPF